MGLFYQFSQRVTSILQLTIQLFFKILPILGDSDFGWSGKRTSTIPDESRNNSDQDDPQNPPDRMRTLFCNFFRHFDISFLFCEGFPSSDNLTVGVSAFLTPFSRKNVKLLPQGADTGIKKAGASSLRKSPARLKGVKKESRTPPGRCQRPDQEPAPKIRGSARQEPLCTQLSCRLHFVIGCKYGFTWSVSDTFAEI